MYVCMYGCIYSTSSMALEIEELLFAVNRFRITIEREKSKYCIL